MTDQAIGDASVSSETITRPLARALAPTAAFWFAMYVASALGANLGDYWAEDLGLGLPTSFATLSVICALLVWGDRENGSRTEAFFWAAIVCLRAVATNIGDFLTHTVHMDYLLATVVLGALTLVLGALTLPALGSASPRIDLRYWTAMVVGGVFGTIGGDMVSHTVGLFMAAVILAVILLSVIRSRTLAAPTAVVGYWCIVLAERAAGTPMGDWIAKGRGLGLGLPISMLIVAAILLVTLALRAASTRTPGAGLGVTARVVLPAVRLALFVLSLVGCFFMLAIYVFQHPADPSFVLCYGFGLAANALYLGIQELASLGQSRMGRLIALWLAVRRQEFDRWAQAREAELRERVR